MITRDLYEKILKLHPISYSCLNCCYQQYDIPNGKTLEQLLSSENFNFLCRKCNIIFSNVDISDYRIDCSNSYISTDGCICHLYFVNQETKLKLSVSFNQQDLRELLQNSVVEAKKLLSDAHKENDLLKKKILKQEKPKKTIKPSTSNHSTTTKARRIVIKKSGENL